MEGINAYLCETYLNGFSGHWRCDALRDGRADALGIDTLEHGYVSFLDAVYRRFYEEDLPLCYVFCAFCGLDYSEMPQILGAKYQNTSEEAKQ